MELPPYAYFPLLTGNRIRLRKITVSDIDSLVPISFYDGQQASSAEEAGAMQEKIDQDYADGNSIHWGIADNNDQIVGTCGYYRGFENHSGELGCILLPEFKGKGYMGEALQLAIDFGKDQMQLQRIFAITSTQNEGAIRLVECLGFFKTKEMEDKTVEYELKLNQK